MPVDGVLLGQAPVGATAVVVGGGAEPALRDWSVGVPATMPFFRGPGVPRWNLRADAASAARLAARVANTAAEWLGARGARGGLGVGEPTDVAGVAEYRCWVDGIGDVTSATVIARDWAKVAAVGAEGLPLVIAVEPAEYRNSFHAEPLHTQWGDFTVKFCRGEGGVGWRLVLPERLLRALTGAEVRYYYYASFPEEGAEPRECENPKKTGRR